MQKIKELNRCQLLDLLKNGQFDGYVRFGNSEEWKYATIEGAIVFGTLGSNNGYNPICKNVGICTKVGLDSYDYNRLIIKGNDNTEMREKCK